MKLRLIGFLFCVIAFTGIFVSCSDDDDSSSGPDTTPPAVSIAAPADGSDIIGGLPLTITATASDKSGVSKVEFFIDYLLASTDSIPSPFEYIWGTVDKEGDHDIYLKAYDKAGNIGVSDTITVTVTPTQNLTVNVPNGSESWSQGSIHDIIWNENVQDTLVKIELFRSTDFQYVITNSTENDGVFSWTIPSDQLPATDYIVKITGTETTISDVSNSGFTITDAPFVQVITPNGGENWNQAGEYEIRWLDNIAEQVKIELFRASTLELTIADSTDSDGSFMWTIPDTVPIGSNFKVKISSYPVNTVIDNSDASFTISAP
jgi:hypothetical protein